MKQNKIELNNRSLVGLDIGTETVSFVVCEEQHDGIIDLLGVGERPADGMQRGLVSNIDSLVSSIRTAKVAAEQMAMRDIDSVFVGVTGSHIRSTNSTGVVAIRGNEVTTDDVERVSESAQAVPISSDERLLHIISQQYIVDGQTDIRNPLGMCGIRLEAKVHVVVGNASPIENLLKCIRLCDLEVEDMILSHIASGQAVLTEDDKALGSAMLDIGDGTTDFAVYSEGSIVHSAAIAIAGSQITQDIAVSLHTPRYEAARIKKKFGSAVANNVGHEETFELTAIGDARPSRASRRYLAEVIEARLEEIFLQVRDNLEKTGQIELIRSGIVLTGGTSNIVNIEKLANRIFNMPVRLGTSNYAGEMNELVKSPAYATGIGLCEYGSMIRKHEADLIGDDARLTSGKITTKASGLFRKLFTREQPGVLQPH